MFFPGVAGGRRGSPGKIRGGGSRENSGPTRTFRPFWRFWGVTSYIYHTGKHATFFRALHTRCGRGGFSGGGTVFRESTTPDFVKFRKFGKNVQKIPENCHFWSKTLSHPSITRIRTFPGHLLARSMGCISTDATDKK